MVLTDGLTTDYEAQTIHQLAQNINKFHHMKQLNSAICLLGFLPVQQMELLSNHSNI